MNSCEYIMALCFLTQSLPSTISSSHFDFLLLRVIFTPIPLIFAPLILFLSLLFLVILVLLLIIIVKELVVIRFKPLIL